MCTVWESEEAGAQIFSQLHDPREVAKPPEGPVFSAVTVVDPTWPVVGLFYRLDELMPAKCQLTSSA